MNSKYEWPQQRIIRTVVNQGGTEMVGSRPGVFLREGGQGEHAGEAGERTVGRVEVAEAFIPSRTGCIKPRHVMWSPSSSPAQNLIYVRSRAKPSSEISFSNEP